MSDSYCRAPYIGRKRSARATASLANIGSGGGHVRVERRWLVARREFSVEPYTRSPIHNLVCFVQCHISSARVVVSRQPCLCYIPANGLFPPNFSWSQPKAPAIHGAKLHLLVCPKKASSRFVSPQCQIGHVNNTFDAAQVTSPGGPHHPSLHHPNALALRGAGSKRKEPRRST